MITRTGSVSGPAALSFRTALRAPTRVASGLAAVPGLAWLPLVETWSSVPDPVSATSTIGKRARISAVLVTRFPPPRVPFYDLSGPVDSKEGKERAGVSLGVSSDVTLHSALM